MYDRENAKLRILPPVMDPLLHCRFKRGVNGWFSGSRYEDKTGLVLRILKPVMKKWLGLPVQRETRNLSFYGVLPGYSFTPDSKAVVASYGGKYIRIPVDGSKPIEISLPQT
jgi:hypothetical protein